MANELFYRSYEIEERKVDTEKRSVSVSFSSEMPVRRWFGDEYLLHGTKNVNLARLRSMGAALLNHKSDFIIGALKGISLDSEKKKGRAEIVFDDDEQGNLAMKKVQSGSLRGVSVGYQVEKFREVLRDEDYELEDGRKIKGPAMVAIRWTPYEISLTPVPADTSVGVGRSATRSLDGIHIERNQNNEGQDMDEKQVQDIVRAAIEAAMKPENIRAIMKPEPEKTAESGKTRGVDYDTGFDLLSRASAVNPGAAKGVMGMLKDGKAEAEILRYISDEAIKDAGGHDSANIPPGGGDGKSEARKIEAMDEDEFVRMLTNVTSIPYFD